MDDAPLSERAELQLSRLPDDTLLLQLSGGWRLQNHLPAATDALRQLASDPQPAAVAFDTGRITTWDTGLLTFLRKITAHCHQAGIPVDRQGLPAGVRRLLDLAAATPERQGARRTEAATSLLTRIGHGALAWRQGTTETLAFIGEATLAFGRLFTGQARFRRSDLVAIIQECGPQALPIVTLISFLVGLILAFMGAIQLRQFGAQVYVADLVGLGMAREMGAMMTAIIMAGRTGAAFAAQLGTMTANEEIDALKTLGIPVMDFLVLPRLLALMLMLPLLCLYANLVGILGGLVIGVGMLDLGFLQYFYQTQIALTLTDFGLGLIKSAVYGVLIAFAGCLRGIQCGRSASAVGAATTSAVVTSIVLIVIASAALTVIYDVLGI